MSIRSRYDVVVIGAGPSGTSAAYHLARLGHEVLLVEKDRLPREKACGDGLTPRTLSKLAEMGVGDIPGMMKISGVRLFEHLKGSEQTLLYEPDGKGTGHGAVLPRSALDYRLATVAEERGADLRTETHAVGLGYDRRGRPETLALRCDGKEEEVAASFFVVCEGSAGSFGSLLRRRSPDRGDLEFAVRQYFEGSFRTEPFFDVHFPVYDGEQVVPGYGWAFPVRSGLLNVGAIFMYGTGFTGKIRIRRLYERFIETLAGHDVRFRSGAVRPCSPLVGASLRIGLVPDETIAPGLVAAGDAAALVNPFDGEGISYALESGELAAQAIHEALREGRSEASTYPDLLRQRYRRHARLRPELSKIFGLVRVYDWHPPNLTGIRRGILAPCLRNVFLDDSHPPSRELREALWDGLLEEGPLADKHRAVETRVVDSIGEMAPIFGELSLLARRGALGLPGYLSALVLLAGSLRGALGERERSIAVAGELVMMSLLFLGDVKTDAGSKSSDEGKPMSAVALLIADGTIARIFALLDELDPAVSALLSRAIARDAGGWVERRLSSRLHGSDPTSIGEADDRRVAFVSEIVGIVATVRGYEPAVDNALRAYSELLSRSLCQLVDLWVDVRGHELDGSGGSFYLARRGHYGEHVAEARRRGLDLDRILGGGAGDPAEADSSTLVDRLAQSGCIAHVLDVARANARAAESALEGLPQDVDRTGLRILVGNVERAIAVMEADPRWADSVTADTCEIFTSRGIHP